MTDRFPLTKPQKLIYDTGRYAGGSVNMICACALLPGHLDETVLQQAVNRFYEANEAMRTQIIIENDTVCNRVLPYSPRTFTVKYFASREELDSFANEWGQIPLNADGPLSEFFVVYYPDWCGWITKVHHLISDAWSLCLFADQLAAFAKGKPVEAFPYSDYLDTEAAYMQGNRRERAEEYYLSRFEKVEELVYLSDRHTESFRSKRKQFSLTPQKSAQLQRFLDAESISAAVFFLQLMAICISRMNMNAQTFYIGLPMLNRRRGNERKTIGCYINTVPLLVQLDNEASLLENLRTMRAECLTAMTHQRYHYEDVKALLRQKHQFSGALYDVLMSYQNIATTDPDVQTCWYHNGTQMESLQLHAGKWLNSDQFTIWLDYQTDKFTAQQIDAFSQHLLILLDDAIMHPEKPLYALEWMSGQEKMLVLQDYAQGCRASGE